MRLSSVSILIIIIMMLFSIHAAPVAGAVGEAPQGPAAVVPEPDFEHPTVLEGEDLFHDYIIRNTGTAELEIKSVRTG